MHAYTRTPLYDKRLHTQKAHEKEKKKRTLNIFVEIEQAKNGVVEKSAFCIDRGRSEWSVREHTKYAMNVAQSVQ